jgi:hypothetical protein
MNKNNIAGLVFFLGGVDAEMIRIAEVLKVAGVETHDKKLTWGAAASAYAEEIQQAAKDGKAPVLVELKLDIELPKIMVVIDHHDDKAGRLPAIIQVLNLLGIQPTRQDILIGAHDAAYIQGLIHFGATLDEIAEMIGGKALDLYIECAQDGSEEPSLQKLLQLGRSMYIAPKLEEESARAVEAAEWINGVIVVRQSHSKAAPVTDRLIGKQEVQNILIFSGDGEVNYYGTGETVKALAEQFPGGWTGGAGLCEPEPETVAFWGGNPPTNAFFGGYPNHQEVLEFLTARFAQ